MLALPDYRRHDPYLSSCFLYGNVSKPTHYGVHLAIGQRSSSTFNPAVVAMVTFRMSSFLSGWCPLEQLQVTCSSSSTTDSIDLQFESLALHIPPW